MCKLLGVPEAVLPTIVPSAAPVAATRRVPGLPDGIPIAGIAGDQQAALFGQACFDQGDAKCTYGTGAFLLVNTGSEPVTSASGLLSTMAWQIGDRPVYALEGSVFIAGAAVQWLRDGLGIIRSASEVEALARSVDSTGGVVFVPALSGLGAPYWDPGARGLVTGITRGTTRAHIARATLEAIALQVDDVLRAMRKDRERGRFRACASTGARPRTTFCWRCRANFRGVGRAADGARVDRAWGGDARRGRRWRVSRRFRCRADGAPRAELRSESG